MLYFFLFLAEGYGVEEFRCGGFEIYWFALLGVRRVQLVFSSLFYFCRVVEVLKIGVECIVIYAVSCAYDGGIFN